MAKYNYPLVPLTTDIDHSTMGFKRKDHGFTKAGFFL